MNTLIIKDGTKKILDEEFANSTYEEIIIPDSVTEIGYQAFANSRNLKRIKLSNNLKLLEDEAFKDCVSLESVEIPESLTYLSRLCFANCTSLKHLKLHDDITYFNHLALFNCINLEDFALPKNLTYLGTRAMFNCKKIKRLRIPASLNDIECGAFGYMESLEEIVVDPKNEKYKSFDCISLIETTNGVFMQYALASKNKCYKIESYPISIDGMPTREFIYNIADFAFAGAKNLETLDLTAAIESFGPNTFKDTNMKTLNILYQQFSKNVILNSVPKYEEAYFPFTEINLEEGIEALSDNMSNIFKNIESITLPSTLIQIGAKVFSKSSKVKELFIPISCGTILESTFPPEMILHFEDIGDVYGEDFASLQTKLRSGFERSNERNTRIYLFRDGTYKVLLNDFAPITINRNDIERFSTSSNVLADDPDLFIRFFLKIQLLHSRFADVFYKCVNDDDIYDIFKRFFQDFDNIEKIANEKIKELINSIIGKENRFKQTLLNGYLMKHVSMKNIQLILNNYTPELERFLSTTNYLEYLNKNKMYDQRYYDFTYIVNYTNLLHKYKVKDKLFYNVYLAFDVTLENQELLIKHYSKNLKRLLLASNCLNNPTSINDLINLIRALGGFSEDPIISQKVLTFITEKMINGTKNKKMTPDRIHKIFNEFEVKEDINYEFVNFFITNYAKLLDVEKNKAGFIANVYNEFENISACSLANNVSSRQLKVTIEKCLFYLVKSFDNITPENQELAALLCKYYFEDEVLTKAEELMNEALSAPRNIFTDSNREDEDLKCTFSDGYSYEWLYKQSMENLVLGKYCHCCSHVRGNGAGIVRASMTDPNVQNLIIRDEDGFVIAKSTFYVNKELGYGIFNNIETSDDCNDEEMKERLYEIFMKALLDFIGIYNKNRSIPIREVHIGTNQNQLLDQLCVHHHIADNLQNINYSKYAYTIKDKVYGKYVGDANVSQLCLYKK